MVYDEGLAFRVRQVLKDITQFEEKKMFGGLGYMVEGNMCCGIIGDDLIVRVGKDNYERELDHQYTREFDFTGRPMRGWIVVMPDGLSLDEDLEKWINKGYDFASSLPAK